jgi:hypothetical protein
MDKETKAFFSIHKNRPADGFRGNSHQFCALSCMLYLKDIRNVKSEIGLN